MLDRGILEGLVHSSHPLVDTIDLVTEPLERSGLRRLPQQMGQSTIKEADLFLSIIQVPSMRCAKLLRVDDAAQSSTSGVVKKSAVRGLNLLNSHGPPYSYATRPRVLS